MGAQHVENSAEAGSAVAGQAAAIFALGLAARWIYIHQAGDHVLWEIPVGAAIGHIERAAAGEGAAGFTSLYDVFLAGAARGQDYSLVRGIQVVLGAGNCVMAWLLARAAFSPGVAVAAGLATALYGPSIMFSGELLPAVLATSLVLLSLILLHRALSSPEPRSYVLPGLLLGSAVLAEWWVSLFALTAVIWLLLRKDQGAGAAGHLVIGMSALLLPAFLWSAWTPDGVDLGLVEGFRRVYALWQGTEFLLDLDPYYARQHSSLLSALLWDSVLAFPFGLVAPLTLLGMVSRLRAERAPVESILLLFVGCFTAQAFLSSAADSAVRAVAVPLLLIFAAVAVAALKGLPRRRAPAALAACLVLAVGLNIGTGIGPAGEAGRARQHHWLGHAYAQLGLRANSVREYETAIAMGTGRDTYYALAQHYLDQGDNLRAGSLYESLLQRWPDQGDARKALADQYMITGRASEAAQLYRELIGEQPGSATAHLVPLLGKALARSGDVEGSIEAFREALELGLESTDTRAALGLLYANTGRFSQAAEAYRTLFDAGGVVDFGPPLAEVLIRDRREAEAGEVLEQVLQVEPVSAAALGLRSKQLFEQGRHREAATYFERLRSVSPEDYRVYFYLTQIYEQLGERPRAEDAYALYLRYRGQKEREGIHEQMQLTMSAMTEQIKSLMEPR